AAGTDAGLSGNDVEADGRVWQHDARVQRGAHDQLDIAGDGCRVLQPLQPQCLVRRGYKADIALVARGRGAGRIVSNVLDLDILQDPPGVKASEGIGGWIASFRRGRAFERGVVDVHKVPRPDQVKVGDEDAVVG